ncbi:transposase [Kocuria sp. UBA1838]|uniref:transposase n=1 Tax=Kocuria sp. UBA1838 TaxID=1946673 RepID=UPI00257FD382|nr:transposase [Kocuria sp. UBA1838]
MPAPYPQEFRDDVVRLARTREDGVTIAQIAKDFGVHEMTLRTWIRQADIDDGSRPGRSREESTEMRDARKRIRLLEQENEVLRRAAAYLSQANLPGKRLFPRKREVPPPLVSELAADGIPVATTLRSATDSSQMKPPSLAR